MIDWAISHVPVKARGEAFLYIFVVLAFVLGFATNMLYKERVVTQIVHTHPTLQQMLGKPNASGTPADVASSYPSLICDLYASKKVIVCHP